MWGLRSLKTVEEVEIENFVNMTCDDQVLHSGDPCLVVVRPMPLVELELLNHPSILTPEQLCVLSLETSGQLC